MDIHTALEIAQQKWNTSLSEHHPHVNHWLPQAEPQDLSPDQVDLVMWIAQNTRNTIRNTTIWQDRPCQGSWGHHKHRLR